MPPFPIRPRTDADRPAVAGLLLATHETDGYPIVLPPDLEAWGAADDVVEAWVAVDDADDGEVVVGHAVLTEADGGAATPQWEAATGLDRSELGVVRRLVVHRSAQGTGTGAALLATAVDAAHRLGRRPVLDMSDNLTSAGALYRRAGFVEVGAYDLQLPGHLLHVLTWVGPPPDR
ncbi:MAG: GNAT family N-acetyltransferase [Actinobacteria bacterium]|nr:GNAT family N-acetyltransferase [Actinomycetota bacterium]